jgi:hypothetical protein
MIAQAADHEGLAGVSWRENCLGAVLYELLCGRRPFTAATEGELIDQILHREARPPRQIRDSILPEQERICLKALSKQINERYATARDMADELWRVAERDRVPANLPRPTGIRPDEWYALVEAAHGGKSALLPTQPPPIAGYEFYLYHEPVAWNDFYDFIQMAEGRLAVVLGDVGGTGMPAAVLMTKLVRSLRSLAHDLTDPAAVLTALNRSLIELGLPEHFVTLLYLCIEPANHAVSVVNAGHLPPLIRRKGSTRVEELIDRSRYGMPLGVSLKDAYEAVSVPLEPGDTVLLFTDGVSEAKNPSDEHFGFKHLGKAFAKASSARAGEAVVKALRTFTIGQRPYDDITLIAFARKQPGVPGEATVTLPGQTEGPVAGAPVTRPSPRVRAVGWKMVGFVAVVAAAVLAGLLALRFFF